MPSHARVPVLTRHVLARQRLRRDVDEIETGRSPIARARKLNQSIPLTWTDRNGNQVKGEVSPPHLRRALRALHDDIEARTSRVIALQLKIAGARKKALARLSAQGKPLFTPSAKTPTRVVHRARK